MKRRATAMVMAFVLMLSLLPTTALAAGMWIEVSGIEGGQVLFDEETGIINKVDDTIIKANIPSEIHGVPVVGIDTYAFSNCSELDSVVIPNSVTYIRHGAFENCSNLKSIVIPDSVTSIQDYAFTGCSSLTDVTIPEGITKLEDNTFSGCSNLVDIVLPSNLQEIDAEAFAGCSSLTRVTIPEGVTWVQGRAFADCDQLEKVIIPETVTKTGCGWVSDSVFEGCPNLISAGPIGSSCNIEFGWTEKIPDYAFYGCSSLTSVTLPDGTASIGQEAFAECPNLTSAGPIGSGCDIEFGWTNNVPNWAFSWCKTLSSITLPESITSIGEGAFHGCTNLTNVVVPAGVTSIGGSAFMFSGLTNIIIPDSIVSINNALFYECTDLTVVSLPSNLRSIGQSSFYGCSNLTSIEIPSTVNCIENGAFMKCSSLPSVVIPDGVTTIELQTFSDCSSLTSITLPEDITAIGAHAFANCNNLTDAYYAGSASDWTQIPIGSSNECLVNSTIHYGKESNDTILTFETNGGSFISAVTQEKDTVVNLTKYIPTRFGYTFDGWYSDKNLTKAVTSVKLTTNTTVYAKWTQQEAPAGLPFVDVNTSDWFCNDVKYAYDNGMMNGTSPNKFSPAATTTRGMIVTILYRLENEPAVTGHAPFTDVAAGQWYTDAVNWAAANKVVNGTSPITFAPNAPITREQMAAILYRYAQFKGYDVSEKADLSKFSDSGSVSGYAVDALAWANAEGLINGVGQNTLSPKGNAIRAQVAAILARFCENAAK